MNKSIGNNRYKIKFDNGTVKEVYSNSLCIEESSSGIPIEKSIPMAVKVTEDPNVEEMEDITFPIDSAGIDDLIDSGNEDNDDMNKEVEINIREINVPADAPPSNNNTANTNDTPLTYQQKLEAKYKEIHALISISVTKEQNKLTIN